MLAKDSQVSVEGSRFRTYQDHRLLVCSRARARRCFCSLRFSSRLSQKLISGGIVIRKRVSSKDSESSDRLSVSRDA